MFMKSALVFTALCAVNSVLSSSQTYDDVTEFEGIFEASTALAARLPDSEEIAESLGESVDALKAMVESLSKIPPQEDFNKNNIRIALPQMCEALIRCIEYYLQEKRPEFPLVERLLETISQFRSAYPVLWICESEMNSIQENVKSVVRTMKQEAEAKVLNVRKELLEKVKARITELGLLPPTTEVSAHMRVLEQLKEHIVKTIPAETHLDEDPEEEELVWTGEDLGVKAIIIARIRELLSDGNEFRE